MLWKLWSIETHLIQKMSFLIDKYAINFEIRDIIVKIVDEIIYEVQKLGLQNLC